MNFKIGKTLNRKGSYGYHPEHNFYIGDELSPTLTGRYLHKDGSLHFSTHNKQGEWSGWYNTRKDCIDTLVQYDHIKEFRIKKYPTIRIDRLWKVLLAGKRRLESGSLNMQTWKNITACGTTHCLFGGYVEDNKTEFFFSTSRYNPQQVEIFFEESPGVKGNAYAGTRMEDHLGLTSKEFMYLFTHTYRDRQPILAASWLTPQAALNRLEKFIKHKTELFYKGMIPAILEEEPQPRLERHKKK